VCAEYLSLPSPLPLSISEYILDDTTQTMDTHTQFLSLPRPHSHPLPPRPPTQTDEAAAASAVRNLNGVEVNDRALRIEASSDTPNHKQAGRSAGGGGGGGGGGGRGAGGGRGGRERSSPPPPFRPPPPGAGYGAPPMGGPGPGPGPGYGGPPPMGGGGGGPPAGGGRMDFGMLPPGIDLPRGEKALDQITKTLAEIPAGQLQDVMAGMKVSPDSLSFSPCLCNPDGEERLVRRGHTGSLTILKQPKTVVTYLVSDDIVLTPRL